MCGLVGAFGELERKHIIALSYLGILSSLRGDQSTGIMWSRTDAGKTSYTSWKTLTCPDVVFAPGGYYMNELANKQWADRKEKKSDKVTSRKPSCIAIHTRFATKGGVTIRNAHPFKIDHIMGMHNGTVHCEFEDKDKFQTDSEGLFNRIAADGDEFLKELYRKYNAAYALTWFNSKENTFNVFKNSQRPLYSVYTNDRKVCFYASDEYWLKAVLPFFGIKQMPHPIPIDKKFSFNVNGEYSNIINTVREKSFVTVSPMIPRGGYGHNSGKDWSLNNPVSSWEEYDRGIQNPPVSRTFTERQNDLKKEAGLTIHDDARPGFKEDQPIKFKGKFEYLGWMNRFYTKEEMIKNRSDGCVTCDAKVPLLESVRWLNHDNFICQECNQSPELVKLAELEVKKLEEEDKFNDDIPNDLVVIN